MIMQKTLNYLTQFTPEEIKRRNKEQHKQNEKEYTLFREKFSKGFCYICGEPLEIFKEENPCVHWLLRPKGFKKKNFKPIYEKYGYFKLQAYLRWVANEENIFKNINDLLAEKTDKKLFETTIRFKNIEWSFSCDKSDYVGHTTSLISYPHYHFQMFIDQKPFITFSDFHIPFTNYDIWQLEMLSHSDKFKHRFVFGEGMEHAMSAVSAEDIINNSSVAEDETQALYNFSTTITAEPGSTISGNEIHKLLKESKEKNIPMAKLARSLKNVSFQTIIYPSADVPEIAKRKGRNSRLGKNK